MTSCNNYKNKNNLKNVKRAAYIKYKLYSAGLTLNDIALDLKISNSAVYRSINGLSKISRIDDWLKDKLGV